MANLCGAVLGRLSVCGVLGMVIACGAMAGCGDDSSGPGTSGESGASGSSGSSGTGGSTSGTDAGARLDATTADGGAPDATLLDSGSMPDAGSADSAPTPDTGTKDAEIVDASVVTESGIADAAVSDAEVTDVGVPDAGTTDAGAIDAGAGPDADAEAVCVTTIGTLSDAGSALLVAGFDTATGATTDWTPKTYHAPADAGAIADTVEYSATEGATCPGSLAFTVPFLGYDGEQAALEYNFPDTGGYPLWTDVSKVHFAFKVAVQAQGDLLEGSAATPYFPGVNSVASFAQWGNFAAATYNGGNTSTGNYVNGTSLTGGWQSVTLVLDDPTQMVDAGGFPLPMGVSCAEGNACKLAIQTDAPSSAPVGGPATPPTLVIFIDDIWYE
jgi:hypothetical protein